jgi:hypothetical protein
MEFKARGEDLGYLEPGLLYSLNIEASRPFIHIF